MSVKKQGAILLGEGGDAGASGGPVDLLVLQQAVDLASVAASSSVNQDVAVTGLAVGDVIASVNPAEGLTAGVSVAPLGTVAVAATARLRVTNPTIGAVDAASATFTFLVLRPRL